MPAKFVPRQRKHRVLARQKASRPQEPTDSNSTEIVPTEQDARRDVMRAELRAQQAQPKISSKKRKRMDHYIDTKLKKEENLELIKKLAAQKVDTSLFRSAKKLGRGNESQREKFERALTERNRGLNVEANEQILFDQREVAADADASEAEDEEPAVRAVPNGVLGNGSASAALSTSTPDVAFGGGLKRPLELGEDGKPMIKRRRRRKAAKVVREATFESEENNDLDEDTMSDEINGDSESEWEGFSANGEEEVDDHAGGVQASEESSNGDSEDGDSSDDEASSSTSSAPEAREARSSAFKAWATQQRNAALGFVPSEPATMQQLEGPEKAIAHERRHESPEPLPQELQASTNPGSTRPAVSVVIPRPEGIQEARLKLPVVQEEQKIMESIHMNTVTVVWGATGSGKTTQVPQMMYESGYGSKIGASNDAKSANDRSHGMIGVTQPRRVAATSVAQRVGQEMGEMKNRIGHQVRFDTSVSRATAIKFMTDGILLREIANDFALSKYSAIVIDEAHERSVNTDILIGLLSRIVDLRGELAAEKPNEFYPLKLVIMSATLRVEDFTRNQLLFRQGPPPIVKAEGRQFSVVEHFARRTQRDYLEEMFQKVSRGHRKLPPGGMLVFLTGQGEILHLAKRLRAAFSKGQSSQASVEGAQSVRQNGPMEAGDYEDDEVNGIQDIADEEGSEDEIHGLSDDDDEDAVFHIEGEEASGSLDAHVLPLYSQLPTKQQMQVFEPPTDGSRMIVLATNIAETSLTIPGIRYVFDCGRSKEKRYESSTGVQTFEIEWISKASAAQRAGRAGRTGPGHCYRLYSSAVYERDFQDYAVPEILRSPVENVALLVKSVNFPNVAGFPFPTPPDRHALAKAEELLTYLGAISASGAITNIGRALNAYPLSPRYGRILMLAQEHKLIAHAIALVAVLAVPEILLPENQLNDVRPEAVEDSDSSDVEARHIRTEAQNAADTAAERRRKDFNRARATLSRWDDHSDAMKLLMAFALCSSPGKIEARCEEYFIRAKGMKEAVELRAQLARIVRAQNALLYGSEHDLMTLPVLETEQRAKLKYILATGFVDQIATRADLLRASDGSGGSAGRKPRRATEVPYRTLFPSSEVDHSLDGEEKMRQQYVYVHASSVLARLSVASMPSYIVYSHLSRATQSTVSAGQGRTRMHPLTTISVKQLVALTDGTPLLEVGKPIGKIETLGRDSEWRERRSCWVGLSIRGRTDGTVWPAGSRKEIQVRVKGAWVTDKVVS